MKKFFSLLIAFVLIGMYSCQEKQVSKQYFEASPEIEMVETLIEAYLNQDWVTFKSYYSDTAKIWSNRWPGDNPGITVDENLESMKASISSIYSYSFEETVINMIISNDGQKYVLFWSKWTGKFTEDGDELVIPVNIVYEFIDTKIVYEYGFWDNLPAYLVEQALLKED